MPTLQNKMPKLQTLVDIPSPGFSIHYNNRILFLGSCFATNIGLKLEKLKFNSVTNPFGVLYNPASIANSIDLLVNRKQFVEDDLIRDNDTWFSFYHHSSFSSPDKAECLNRINETLSVASEFLKDADILFITLGTSWIYRYKPTNQIVSNCHKIPAKEFNREFLEISESVEYLSTHVARLLQSKADIKIILTISPIRHWKDGAIENQRSKSALALAIKELEKMFSNVYYFPVYELFMDEMRDYRFYAADMLHPSNFAVEYVWEKFVETFFDKETIIQSSEIDKLVSMLNHRPMNGETESYKKFVASLKKSIAELKSKYPKIDFTPEEIQIEKR
jgi:hypothetical protein